MIFSEQLAIVKSTNKLLINIKSYITSIIQISFFNSLLSNLNIKMQLTKQHLQVLNKKTNCFIVGVMNSCNNSL